MDSLKRLKKVSGTHNFRDVGGYRASDGTVKWGTLFRSDALNELTSSGITDFKDLGIETVVDLRDDRERTHAPSRLPEGARLLASPIFPDALAHVDRKLTVDTLTDLIFFEHADTLTDTVRLLSEQEAPTLVHCTAGKDRTGAVIALALSSVGVQRDDILQDYAETEKNLAGEWVENHLARLEQFNLEITPDIVGLVSASPLEVLDKTLQKVDSEFGSPVDYLYKHGLNDKHFESLNRLLVS